jgi:hypothetical protein
MQRLLKYFLLVLAAGMLFSCEKTENRIYFEGGTPPALKSNTTIVALIPGKENEQALQLNWTNPAFKFTTGTSSHNVTYLLEIDSTGGNFSSKAKYSTQITNGLSKSFSVAEFNGIMGNSMGLKDTGRAYNLEVRVKAAIKPNNVSAADLFAVPIPSNTIKFTAKPFVPPPKVQVPKDGTLWIIGDGVASGWNNPLPAPYDASQKFTKVSNTLYELKVPLIPGGFYKLIQMQGNWSEQYKFVEGNALSGTLEKRDADPAFPTPTIAGTYKLTIDFQTGTFTAVKQ